MKKHSIKTAFLAAASLVVPLGIFAQAPTNAEPVKKVICIVNSDTIVMDAPADGSKMEWVEQRGNPNGGQPGKVIIMNSSHGPGQMRMLMHEEGEMNTNDPSGGPETQVIVEKFFQGDPSTGGNATVHTITIVNGDTVTDVVSQENVNEMMLIEEEGDSNATVNVQVFDDGNGRRIVMVEVYMLQITDLEGEEANKYGPSKSEALNLKDITYYPNPNDGHFNLRFRSKDKESPVEIVVASQDGKEIYRAVAQGQEGRFDHRIDLDNVAPGVYLLQINQAGMKAVKRISVQ